MKEFFLENYNTIIYCIEAFAVCVGLFCLKKFSNTNAVFFIKILVYLFVIELLGSYTYLYGTFEFLEPIRNSVFKTNRWWFTITFDIVVVILFSILYQKILKNKKHKFILKVGTILFTITAVFLILIDIDTLFAGSYDSIGIIGTLLILTCCVFFFIEILQSSNILEFSRSLYFYVSVAIFIWWLIVTPLVFYDIYFRNIDWNFIFLKWQIYLFANIFMYATFAIGLLVSRPDKIKNV
ncbi:MAG: hypothetical protein ACPG6B_08760 [Oceanihabitans sp.]